MSRTRGSVALEYALMGALSVASAGTVAGVTLRYLRNVVIQLFVFLLLASPTMAGDLWRGSWPTVPTSARTTVRLGASCMSHPAGTSNVAAVGWPIGNAVAFYNATDTATMIKGGYTFSGTTQAYTLATCPVTNYPFTVSFWARVGNSATHRTGVCFIQDATHYHTIYCATLFWSAASNAGGGEQASTSAAVLSLKWVHVVGVFASATSRTVYTNGTAAAANTNSVAFGTPTKMAIGRDVTEAVYMTGDIGNVTIYDGVALSSNEINDLDFYDSRSLQTTTIVGDWPMDNAVTGRYAGTTLTAVGSPTALNAVMVIRDLAGTAHLSTPKAPYGTAAPVYTASSAINGQHSIRFGGNAMYSVTTPVTAAPFQLWCVAATSDTTNTQYAWGITDSAAQNDYFVLKMSGAVANDPIQYEVKRSSVVVFSATTNPGYTASTPRCLYALETSSTSRAVEVDGAGTATDTTSKTPTSIDALALSGVGVSIGGNFQTAGDVTSCSLEATTSTSYKQRWLDWFSGIENVNLP